MNMKLQFAKMNLKNLRIGMKIFSIRFRYRYFFSKTPSISNEEIFERRKSACDPHIIDPECPLHAHLLQDKTIAERNRKRCELSQKLSELEPEEQMEYWQKLQRRRRKLSMTVEQRMRIRKQKGKITGNLVTVSIGFLFLITAFQGLQNLQTSINTVKMKKQANLKIFFLNFHFQK